MKRKILRKSLWSSTDVWCYKQGDRYNDLLFRNLIIADGKSWQQHNRLAAAIGKRPKNCILVMKHDSARSHAVKPDESSYTGAWFGGYSRYCAYGFPIFDSFSTIFQKTRSITKWFYGLSLSTYSIQNQKNFIDVELRKYPCFGDRKWRIIL